MFTISQLLFQTLIIKPTSRIKDPQNLLEKGPTADENNSPATKRKLPYLKDFEKRNLVLVLGDGPATVTPSGSQTKAICKEGAKIHS